MLANLLRVAGPAYRSDEIAYLANAAAFAGKTNALAGSWYGGYSLLLSPFFVLVSEVRQAWPFVVVLNALAVLACLLFLWRALELSGAADQARGFRLLLFGLLVFGSTAYIGWAFGNCLLMALIGAGTMLLAAPTLPLKRAAGIGLVLGYASWVHPTGLLLLIAAGLASLWQAPGPRDWRSGVLIFAIGGGMALSYGRLVHPWLIALQGGGGGHYDRQIGELLHQLWKMPLATLATLAVGVVNGMATSAIATFGYGGTALAAALKARATQPGPSSRGVGLKRVLLFLLISWGLLVLFTSALLPHEPTDLQLAFHQRYIQPVLPALVAFGMALAPPNRRERIGAWLFSALPIALALLVAGVRQPYNNNFSIIDQLPAVTFSLNPEQVTLMLAAGLVTTGLVQLLGWRAFLPLASGFWILGWLQMDRVHRQILHGDSRPPAMAAAASTLANAGLHPCLSTAKTPSIQGEHERLLRYYLSGKRVSFVASGQAVSPRCDVLMRPVDSEAEAQTRLHPVGSRPCLPVVADTHTHEVLEDCRGLGAPSAEALEQRLLPARRDLVSLAQVRRHQPPGFAVVALLHSDALPPERPRNAPWWGAGKTPPTWENVAKGQLLLYGPYLSLPKGRYRALFDGLVLHAGSLQMAVTSEEGKRQHASQVLQPGGGPAVIDFSLERDSQDVEVTLRAATAARLRLPSSLVIYGPASVGSSPWSSLGGGR